MAGRKVSLPSHARGKNQPREHRRSSTGAGGCGFGMRCGHRCDFGCSQDNPERESRRRGFRPANDRARDASGYRGGPGLKVANGDSSRSISDVILVARIFRAGPLMPKILGVRCRAAAVADSFCCGLPVIRTGIFPRACWPNATCSGLPHSSRNTPRSCRSIFSGGYEQTHLSGIGHRLRPLVQLRLFRESGFRARVRPDVCRRKARHPSGMLRLRDPPSTKQTFRRTKPMTIKPALTMCSLCADRGGRLLTWKLSFAVKS